MTADDYPILGIADGNGGFRTEAFDPSKPEHVELMHTFAHDCDECRAMLERLAPATPKRDPDAPNRAERRLMARRARRARKKLAS